MISGEYPFFAAKIAVMIAEKGLTRCEVDELLVHIVKLFDGQQVVCSDRIRRLAARLEPGYLSDSSNS